MELCKLMGYISKMPLRSVRDVTWMSDQPVHLAKWMAALEQVTVRHLANCKLCQIPDFCERHLAECHWHLAKW